MLSLTQLKKNIFPLFKVMKATGTIFEIVYRGVVYNVHVQATKKKPNLTRAKKARRQDIAIQALEVIPCVDCDSLRIAGICMNKECISNKGAH